MKIYTLRAHGQYVILGGKGVMLSQQAFLTREAAEAYIPTFRRSVCLLREGSLRHFSDDETLVIRINEHVVVEEDSDGRLD